ncbi:uncharacterized protein LOC115236198 isoform X1 [Formica exsecta]|uniref:uncharacterized protein LOC115236198 isoform X1 n=1 Tax=Formica exsecta TaxID=72781 RepID=UPI0011448A22|nr:uncharacterized protein LOC115236198 isoform X1 [Formica exsecta]
MAMYAVASSSISDQSRIDIENNETMEKNAEKKCYERTFTEHDLCPFVSENYEITLNDALTDTNMSLIVRKLSFSFADVAMVLRHKSGSTGDKSNDGKSMPVCTLFHPHASEDVTVARISPDAKQIITVSNEKCQNVHIWLWSHGRDKPDGLLP